MILKGTISEVIQQIKELQKKFKYVREVYLTSFTFIKKIGG